MPRADGIFPCRLIAARMDAAIFRTFRPRSIVKRGNKNHLAPWHQTCCKIHNNIHRSSTGLSEENMADDTQKNWRDLCVAVTNEKDSTKLSSLLQELIDALDRGERNWSRVGTVCVSA
jgi:hypothetical protein